MKLTEIIKFSLTETSLNEGGLLLKKIASIFKVPVRLRKGVPKDVIKAIEFNEGADVYPDYYLEVPFLGKVRAVIVLVKRNDEYWKDGYGLSVVFMDGNRVLPTYNSSSSYISRAWALFQCVPGLSLNSFDNADVQECLKDAIKHLEDRSRFREVVFEGRIKTLKQVIKEVSKGEHYLDTPRELQGFFKTKPILSVGTKSNPGRKFASYFTLSSFKGVRMVAFGTSMLDRLFYKVSGGQDIDLTNDLERAARDMIEQTKCFLQAFSLSDKKALEEKILAHPLAKRMNLDRVVERHNIYEVRSSGPDVLTLHHGDPAYFGLNAELSPIYIVPHDVDELKLADTAKKIAGPDIRLHVYSATPSFHLSFKPMTRELTFSECKKRIPLYTTEYVVPLTLVAMDVFDKLINMGLIRRRSY